MLTSMLTDTEFELTALIPAARYNCSVTAFNNVGEGSKSQLTFTTQEDGKHTTLCSLQGNWSDIHLLVLRGVYSNSQTYKIIILAC